jgi:restriction system protein
MGAFRARRIEILTSLSELTGYKSGLALTRREIADHLGDDAELFDGADDDVLRIRSEEYEKIVRTLLYRLGAIPSPEILFPGIRMWHRYKTDPALLAVYEGMHATFLELWPKLIDEAKRTRRAIDPTPFVKAVEARFGIAGATMALELVEEFAIFLEQSPWTTIRRVERRDTTELAELFDSENLHTLYGHFFDQRFVDYLNRNFESIDKINWRKFEGLVGEFFARTGIYPELGAGRNDNGIDVRVWPRRTDRDLPPALLIQCKRRKDKVGKVVVKALWADLHAESAKSGLIVTTSALSPGAQAVCTARAYPIKVADRSTLRKWVEAMRTPSSGIFLGE